MSVLEVKIVRIYLSLLQQPSIGSPCIPGEWINTNERKKHFLVSCSDRIEQAGIFELMLIEIESVSTAVFIT